MKTTDVLIIGAGIAGAAAALELARNPRRHITLLTRESDPCESNTRYAQGGIIARGPDDSADLLVRDILAAGAGASSSRAAQILAEEGPRQIEEVLIRTAAGRVRPHTGRRSGVWQRSRAFAPSHSSRWRWNRQGDHQRHDGSHPSAPQHRSYDRSHRR
jgi:succinate dehydrogenase/fumarate reductase flavoprotein subunit